MEGGVYRGFYGICFIVLSLMALFYQSFLSIFSFHNYQEERQIFNLLTLPHYLFYLILLYSVGFGQSEPLTNRLKRLLEDYTDGFAIPKELVQNADDAGATEVGILLVLYCIYWKISSYPKISSHGK